MNIVSKPTEQKRSRHYVVLHHVSRKADYDLRVHKFRCEELGEDNWEARKLGFLTFVDAFISPESLATGPLSTCTFDRAGSFEKVGRYLGTVMKRTDESNGKRDLVE